MDCRALAANVIADVIRQKGSLATLLPDALQQANTADRALLQELCYGALRHSFSLKATVHVYLEKPLREKDTDILALLLIGSYQLQHMRTPVYAAINSAVSAADCLHKSWAKGLVNAILRKVSSAELRHNTPSEEVHYDHPQWLINLLRTAWPAQAEDLLAANNSRAPLTLRVNRLRSSRDAYLQQLANAGISAQPCAHSEVGVRLDNAMSVELLPGFADGVVSVQDESAQLCAGLLQLAPHQRVLDACAAPGGKCGHLLEREPSLSLLAMDRDESRCTLIRENLSRLRLSASVACADAGDPQTWQIQPQYFDRMLLDAPCSATGVIRHHPDIKLLRRDSDIPALANQQGRLLQALWPQLRPGGKLLYATCSLLPQENDDVITNFLRRTPDAKVETLSVDWGIATPHGRQLLTEKGAHDGFYYARLLKTEG